MYTLFIGYQTISLRISRPAGETGRGWGAGEASYRAINVSVCVQSPEAIVLAITSLGGGSNLTLVYLLGSPLASVVSVLLGRRLAGLRQPQKSITKVLRYFLDKKLYNIKLPAALMAIRKLNILPNASNSACSFELGAVSRTEV